MINLPHARMDELMNGLYVRAVLAGILFSLWPLCMNRSGLSGYMSAACFTAATLLGILPFALMSNGLSIPPANWKLVALAGLIGCLGLMLFTGMLAKATPRSMGTLFIIVNLVQLAVAASYQSYMNGTLPPHKIGGYFAAALATYLLTR